MFEPDRESPVVPGRVVRHDPLDRSIFPRSDAPMLPDGGAKGDGKSDLDSSDNRQVHARLMSYYHLELEKQGPNRAEMALDYEFYDGNQWSAEDRAVMESRGQRPLTYNVIATTVDWAIGTERRGRTDFKVLARRKDGARQAELKTDLLKYLNDVNRAGFSESRAFEEGIKGGVGWIEEGVQDDTDGEPAYIRTESWRNILHDSSSVEPDLSDARFIFRTKWVDLDIAESMFPKRKGFLRIAALNADRWGSWTDDDGDDAMDSQERLNDGAGIHRTNTEFGYTRQRVRIIEAWFRKPKVVSKMRGGQFAGEVFDPYSNGHIAEIAAARAVVVDKTDLRMHVAIMVPDGLLYLGETPYRHNRFPFTPVWAYRRNADNLPYGVIRRLREIQEDVNHRASKALHILSTNKTIMDKGAVDDIDEFAEEASRADAVIVKNPGLALDLNVDRDLAPAHLDLMARSIAMIQQTSGVTDENLGRKTNASSGIAITSRQEQGALATAALFDNLYFAKQVSGEKRLSIIEQFFSEEKQFRITNQRATPSYVTVNSGLPDDDITATKADFVISEDEWRATVRQAQVEQLMMLLREIGPVAPQAVLVVLDLVVEGMDIANRDEIVRRIRQVTGQRDPDAVEPTPEEMAKEQEAAEAAERAKRMEEATIAEKEASARQKGAAAEKSTADAEKVRMAQALDAVNVQLTAIQAALAALSAPGAVPVADQMLHEAGFRGRTEQDEDAEVDARASELEQMALEGAAMQEAAAMSAPAQMPPPAAPMPQ